MPREPQTADDWAVEADEQAKIAAQINADSPVKSTPQVAGTSSDEETTTDEVVAEQPQVTLRPVADADIEYPLSLSVVGAPEGGFVFDGPDSTIDVDPQVAEQVTYVPSVEVVA